MAGWVADGILRFGLSLAKLVYGMCELLLTDPMLTVSMLLCITR
jgi:hypothetical protein